MESDEAWEKNMGRRKVGWARSICIGISEVPIDPVKREQIYEGRDICSREG